MATVQSSQLLRFFSPGRKLSKHQEHARYALQPRKAAVSWWWVTWNSGSASSLLSSVARCPPWPGEEHARQDCLLASCWVAVWQVIVFFQWQQEESCIWHPLIYAQMEPQAVSFSFRLSTIQLRRASELIDIPGVRRDASQHARHFMLLATETFAEGDISLQKKTRPMQLCCLGFDIEAIRFGGTHCLLAAGGEPLRLAQLRALASIMGAVPASCKASSKALEELVVEHALLSSTAAPALRLAASHVLASLPQTAGDHLALAPRPTHVIIQ